MASKRTISEQLREAIRQDGRNSVDLERVSGVHSSQIRRFLAGERMLSLETVDSVCRVLKLTLTKEK